MFLLCFLRRAAVSTVATSMIAVTRPRPVRAPAVRLVLLHHAGGSAGAYRGWARRFPPSWDVCAVDLPGRGRAAGLPPLSTVDDLAGCLLAGLEPLLDRPYAVFGHSMGALVGFGLAVAAGRSGQPAPCWLGVSAHPGPRTADLPPRRHLHRLSSEQLRQAVGRLGGTAAPEPAAWALREPLFRADLLVAETWRPGPAPLVVPVPVTAFAGRSDTAVDAEGMRRWAAHTERFLGVRTFPGGHFYLMNDPDAVAAAITADVTASVPIGAP
jgi:surfactin synthase thioesterase subunit